MPFWEGFLARAKVYGKAVPVITEAFASKQVSSGETWRVYINASDVDGDMDQIYCSHGPTRSVPLISFRLYKDRARSAEESIRISEFGHLWPIPFSDIYLTLSIRDKAGHFSAPATFPLNIIQPSGKEKEIGQEDPPRGTFQDKSLGPIMIVLHSDIG